jgi:hypothetical protein
LSRAIFIVKNCACKFPTHSVKNPDVFIFHKLFNTVCRFLNMHIPALPLTLA